MNDDQFTKLFVYMQDEFKKVNDKLDQKASQASIEQLISTIDGFVKRIDDNEIEQASRDMQFERLLEWARKVSEKTGIQLKDL
jgi:hypothetical protein